MSAPATVTELPVECYHCGLPALVSGAVEEHIGERPRRFCCPGCAAVARTIHAAGFDRYYALRTEPALKSAAPDSAAVERFRIYDQPGVQRGFVTEHGTLREASLVLERVTCAACLWLIEKHLSRLPGVDSVDINYATRQARVGWDAGRIALSRILSEINCIGYGAHPYDPRRRQARLEQERRQLLRRIGVAAAFGMQVMVLAVALYGGEWWGIEPGFRDFFRRAALLLTTPVLVYAGAPFFLGAWRGLRQRRAGMDLPIALGLGIAFAASVVATATGAGHVYFDSIVMFVTFVLGARYVELGARIRSAGIVDRRFPGLPPSAIRLDSRGNRLIHTTVPATELESGDRILVRPGDLIAADGEVAEGQSGVDESLITGESLPVTRGPGDAVIAGAVNIENPLVVRVTRTGPDTTLAGIERLLDEAQRSRPRLARLADRLAGRFVLGVLTIAALVAGFWLWRDPASAVPATIAVLIVTCPCALSLATPAALAAGTSRALRMGILFTRADALETLPRASHFLFDKTGTLTRGRLELDAVEALSTTAADACAGIAAALESGSSHPVAQAIVRAAGVADVAAVSDLTTTAGAGVSGTIAGERFHLGSARHIAASTGLPVPETAPRPDTITVWLASDKELLCAIRCRDQLRPEAADVVRRLRKAGKQTAIVSGDREPVVRAAGRRAGIDTVYAEQTPADKLDVVQRLQHEGRTVAMTGDGINDAPVMARADVSLAVTDTANLTAVNADIVLLDQRLSGIPASIDVAAKTTAVIRQNLAWALGYNLAAVPAAAAGLVPPWLAAAGMSLSSLIVVLNAARLLRMPVSAEPGTE